MATSKAKTSLGDWAFGVAVLTPRMTYTWTFSSFRSRTTGAECDR
jgi:hypothetical protein